MGHVVVMDDSPAQFALTQYAQQLWQQSEPALLEACEYDEIGTLWLAADDEEMSEAERRHDRYKQTGIHSELVSTARVSELEPNVRRPLSGGLLVPRDAVVNASKAASFLWRITEARGGKLFAGMKAVRMNDDGVELAGGTVLNGRVLVNATGVNAAELTDSLEIVPRKGHLVLTDAHPGWVRREVIELGYLKSAHQLTSHSVAFNVQPRRSGQVLIGSSRQIGPTSGEVEPRVIQEMMDRAASYMPAIRELSFVRSWCGFRAATPDKLPLIGPVPGYRCVHAATGHEGLGITTSLATGRLLADMFTGRASSIDGRPYSPQRCATRYTDDNAHQVDRRYPGNHDTISR
jgi:glycine/D-amino acid oxidase-like deaminating enzyme